MAYLKEEMAYLKEILATGSRYQEYVLPYEYMVPEKFGDVPVDNVKYMESLVLLHAMVHRLLLKQQLPLVLVIRVLFTRRRINC